MSRGPWFAPLLPGATARGRVAAALAGAFALGVIGLLAPAPAQLLPFGASIGASTVLLFAVPSSPMASPWAVIGGSMASALSGVAAAALFGPTALGAGMAVGLAIVAMSALRCLHPPGGGYALAPIAAGHGAIATHWWYAVEPVGVSSVLLVLGGILFHRFSGHRYPHTALPVPDSRQFETADIDAALDELGEAFDVTRSDVALLLESAERHAAARRAAPGEPGLRDWLRPRR